MQPPWAQNSHKHLFVWIITPTGLSVPASAPYSLNSTKYPQWPYQNISLFTSVLQSTGCSPIPPNWNHVWPFYLSGPISCFFLLLTPPQAARPPCYYPTTRHAPTWHLRVPYAWTILFPCKYMAPFLTSSVYSKTTFPSRPTQISPYKLATLAPCWRS